MMSNQLTPYSPTGSEYEMVQYGFSPFVPPGPVTQQPTRGGCMTLPQDISNYPPGLEGLSMMRSFLVLQKLDLFEIVGSYERNNRCIIEDTSGKKVYYVQEITHYCFRYWCGPIRPIHMKILDNFGNEVIHLYGPLGGCSCCLCHCCMESMKVYSPPGTLIGTVQVVCFFCTTYFVVKDPDNEILLQIKGPISNCSINTIYKIYYEDGFTKVGEIIKHWYGCYRETCTSANNFGVIFSVDLDVKLKALILGAVILIDILLRDS